MISFFYKRKKKNCEHERVEHAALTPSLPFKTLSIDAASLPIFPIVVDLSLVNVISARPEPAFQYHTLTPLTLPPEPRFPLQALTHLIPQNNQRFMTPAILRTIPLRQPDLHDIINDQFIALVFAIKSISKKIPILFVMEIVDYLISRQNSVKIKRLCTEILDTNETEPPHPNYILRN